MGIPNQLRNIAEKTLPKVLAAITTIMFVTFGLSVLVMGYVADLTGVRTLYMIAFGLYLITAVFSLFIRK
ncbi:hypothetical protein [Thermoactinomyces mirandus]|uniref:hypothetical protein n=1 Tax=Thermoactinomyces mirandus TaxID=2756294 RepID=UPI0015EEDB34|nr:hypothetical protein [Thermoactinomyces mirandus]